MAENSSAAKMTSFFEGRRRKAFLKSWQHLDRKGEDSIKLELRLPLLNESSQGMSGAIAEAFGVMAKDNSLITRTNLDSFAEGMTLEAFTTSDPEESKIASLSCTSATFCKLAVESFGEGETRRVDLHLVAYVPAGIRARDWAWEHRGKEFAIEAVYSQSEMAFTEAEEEEEEALTVN